MPRKLDHVEQIRDAEAAGLHAVLFKDHFYSNTPVMAVLKLGFSAGEIRALTSENACRLMGIDPPANPFA